MRTGRLTQAWKTLILGVVALTAFGFYAPTTHAQATTGCDTQTRDCADEDVRSDGKSRTDLTDSSGKALGSCIANGGNSPSYSSLITAWCGDKTTGSGSLPWFSDVQYTSGDTVKCVSYGAAGIGAYDCVVTHADGSYTGYHNPTSGTVQTRQHSADGTITSASSADAVERAATTAVQGALGSVTGALSDLGSGIIKAVAFFILTLANLLLGIAGTLLNWVVVWTVFKFGSLIGNSPGLLIAWGILRDIGNMLLLFGFIFMGLATILDLHSFPTKKAIPRLLIFAVLMNFSLFAAEAVIDVANTFSTVMYAQANTDGCNSITDGGANSDSTQTQEDCAVNYGIAGHIMQSTGLSTIFSVDNSAGLLPEATALVGLALFATIGAIVLFAAAIMLVIRVIVLTFVMVAAPLGFAGMAIPPLQGFANRWWNSLIHQAFFAPIMFLMIFVSLKVTDSFTAVDADRGLAGALTQPGASVMGIVLIFAIVIGFMIASLIAARSFGAAGASFAISFAKNAALGTYGAASSFAGRNTIGRGSAYAQKKYEAWMGSGHGGVRSLISNTGIDDALANTFKAGQNAQFGGNKSFKSNKEHHEARHKELATAGRKAQLESDLSSALTEQPADDAARQAQNDKIANILERMSTKELEELGALKKAGADLDTLARNLSPEKFAALTKDGGALTEEQKKDLKESRFRDVRDQQSIINDPSKSATDKAAAEQAIKDRIKKYSVKDLENSPSDLLADTNVAKYLSNSQRDDLLKGGKLTPAAARKIREFDPVEQVNAAFSSAAIPAAGANNAANLIRTLRLNPKQAARLKSEVLTRAEVAPALTPKMLQAIQERNEIDDVTTRAIRANILAYGSQAAKDYVEKNPAGMTYWS